MLKTNKIKIVPGSHPNSVDTKKFMEEIKDNKKVESIKVPYVSIIDVIQRIRVREMEERIEEK